MSLTASMDALAASACLPAAELQTVLTLNNGALPHAGAAHLAGPAEHHMTLP